MDCRFLPLEFPVTGCITRENPGIVGVFDGMGGEECGDVASLIASREAAHLTLTRNALNDLVEFCHSANSKICEYAGRNHIRAMGTTAAMLAFTPKGIALCNIGDSKIFRFRDEKLKQISTDHVGTASFGMKPPLSQCLGMPATEKVIEPYVTKCQYNDGDMYLISSDGLTDMLTVKEISEILQRTHFDMAVNQLLKRALENGGTDNITLILCRVERDRGGYFNRRFK